jgi:PKD repeat protein
MRDSVQSATLIALMVMFSVSVSAQTATQLYVSVEDTKNLNVDGVDITVEGLDNSYFEQKYTGDDSNNVNFFPPEAGEYRISAEDRGTDRSKTLTRKISGSQAVYIKLNDESDGGSENSPPELKLISPNSNEVLINPKFRFKADDPDGDELTYKLFVDEGFTAPWSNKVAEYNRNEGIEILDDPVDLKYDTNYQWGVIVQDSNGAEDSKRLQIKTEKEDSNQKPSIDLRSPKGSDANLMPEYRWEISDDQNGMESVKLVVDDDSNPFYNPEFEYTSSDGVSTTANFERSFQHSGDELKEDTSYYWGLEVDDGENTERKMTSFTTSEVEEECSIETRSFTLSPDSVQKGDSTQASISVMNNGDEQEVKVRFEAPGDSSETFYRTLSSNEDITFEETLFPESSGEVEAEAKTRGQPCGSKTVAVKTTDLVVKDSSEPNFNVQITDSNSPVEEGDTLSVDYRVENEGDARDTQKIGLDIDGYQKDSDTVTLNAGESRRGTLYWSTSESDEGYYTAKVSSDDSSDSTNFRVKSRDDTQLDADFTFSPSNPEVGQQIEFDASGSSSSEGIVDYDWSFGDGTDSFGKRTTKTYDSDGEYPVTLTVTDSKGNTDATTRDVYVARKERKCGVSRQDIDFSVSDYTIEEGESTDLELTVSNTGEENQRVKVRLKLGQNTVRTETVYVPSKYSQKITETVSPTEDAFARAEISTEGDSCGSKDIGTFSKEITVLTEGGGGDERPDASFNFEPENPMEGDQVDFDASRSSDDGSIGNYKWRFGDGSRSAGRKVSHIFEEDGTYPVTLTVEDDEGNTDTTTKYVTVGEVKSKCGVSRKDIQFSLEDYVINEGESTEAEIRIFNTAEENQRVQIGFEVGQDIVEQREVTVPGFGSRTITQQVSPDRDSFVRAEVETEGDPCGRKNYKFAKELIVLSDTEEDATLDVEVSDEYDHPIRNARVQVEGPEDRVRYTDSSGDAEFSLEAGDYDVEVNHPDYDAEEDSVNLREGEIEQLRFELERKTERNEGTFQAFVEDGDSGDRIEDTRVEIDGPEERTKYTNRNGFTSFQVEEGRYDVEVSESNYESISTDTVEVEQDETTTRTYRLNREEDDREGIEIVSTDYSGSVCRGGTLSVDVAVDNRDNRNEYVTVTGKGLGSNIVLDGFVLDEGERKERRVRFTNVEGSGRETFRIQARNGTRDSVSRSVTVEDCEPSQPPTQDLSGISMKLSYPISPNKALVGDTVKVSGFVDGVDRRTEVEIDVNGDRKARVSTQPDGYYQTYIRADSVGMKTVRARSGGQSASRQLHVLPTASVGLVEAPRKVFEGEMFEVCAQVRSQVDAKAVLREDGRLIESTNDRGRVCFDVEAQDPGKHVYEVGAYTSGDGSSSRTTVEVLETDVEVESFPDQVASVESGSGMIKVDLYNTKNQMTRYNLDVEGLPSTWLSQSEKRVVLSPGERKEVFFYLTPREEGRYDPEVIVEARNQEIFRQTVDLETGGQNAPRERGLVQRLRAVFSF